MVAFPRSQHGGKDLNGICSGVGQGGIAENAIRK